MILFFFANENISRKFSLALSVIVFDLVRLSAAKNNSCSTGSAKTNSLKRPFTFNHSFL
jgi:hypothetical protein